jgi:hypothetical protein
MSMEVGTVELRDIANILVGGLACYLSYLAIRLGKRQNDMAEVQHQILMNQMRREEQVEVRVIKLESGGGSYCVLVTNKSLTPVTIRSWSLKLWLTNTEVRFFFRLKRKVLTPFRPAECTHWEVYGPWGLPTLKPEATIDLGVFIVDRCTEPASIELGWTIGTGERYHRDSEDTRVRWVLDVEEEVRDKELRKEDCQIL